MDNTTFNKRFKAALKTFNNIRNYFMSKNNLLYLIKNLDNFSCNVPSIPYDFS